MASFHEIRNRLKGNSVTAEKGNVKTTSAATPSGGSSFSEIRKKLKAANPGNTVDESFVNAFLSDADKYISGTEGAYNGMDFDNAASVYEDRQKVANDLRSRSWAIQEFLRKNQGTIDEKTYNGLKSYLDEFDAASSQQMKAFYDKNRFYSQFLTKEAYEKHLQDSRDYAYMKDFDVTAGEKEIQDMEAFYDDVYTIEPWYAIYKANPQRWDQQEISENINKYNALTEKYGSLQGLDKAIQEKKLFLANAKRLQEGLAMEAVADSESELYDPDFKAKSGYVSTQTDDLWAKMTSQFGMGYGDLTYEYINGAQSGMRQEIIGKALSFDADTDDFFLYDHMTDDQIAVYNYHYAKDGKAAADKYLDAIRESLSVKEGTERAEKMKGNTALELLFGIEVGADQFQSGIKNLFNTEDDYIPQTAIQIAGGMVREDLADDGFKLPDWLGGASLGQVGYDAITTTTNMVPSIMTSMVIGTINPVAGQIAGTALMGASASGNAYQEALNLGYDKGQARAYSALVGGSEAGLQYLLGGFGKLGGKLSGNVITKIMSSVDNAFARTALKLGGNMLSEGLEEGLQEILTPWFKNLTLHMEEDVNWGEVAYSSLLGALTAGFMEGGTTISGEVNTYKMGKQLKAADISAERLSALGQTFSADSVAYQLAGRVNENTGAYTMGRLFNEIGATLSEQNITEITNALAAKGMDVATARKNAEALAYVVEGGHLSEKQIAAIEANDVLAEVVRTTLIDANTTWNQRAQGYNEMLKALADEMTAQKASRTNPAQQDAKNAPAADTVDTRNESSAEGRSEAENVDTSPAKVKSITAIKDGRATIKLEDDTEVDIKEADLDPDDGVRIETIASIDGISATDANFLLNTLRTSSNASAQMDALGAKEAYRYGFYGFSQEHLAKHGTFANALTDTQRQAIYETGRNARQQQSEKASPKSGSGSKTEIYFDAGNGNVVAFRDARKTLTEKQSAGVQAAMVLRKLGIGGDIYFFESYRNSEGKLVYKDKHGKEVNAPNGWYSESDGSIHIDLNAGSKGQGFVLYILSHELTHFIEQWSAQKYKILADFLIENYEKGQSVDKLVRAKQEKLSALRGKPVSYKEAYSEVIADSMEAMLADGNVLEKLMELKAKDKALFTKIKQFFDNLLAKLRNVYKGQTPDSAEGRAVLEMTESIEKLQRLFAEALVDASENFQRAEKNTTREGGEVMYMSRAIETVTEDTVKEDLTDVFNGNNVASRSYIPLTKTTPFAVRHITGYKDDLPVIVDKKKSYFDMREDGKFKEDSSHHYHGMGVDGFIEAFGILEDPEYAILELKDNGSEHYAFISANENGEEICIVFQMEVFKGKDQMNGYPGGYYNLDITEFVATEEWLEKHGVEPGVSYKDYLLSFDGNSIIYDRSIHFEQLDKARNIDVGSAGVAASHINNRASNDKLTQPGTIVKGESTQTTDIEADKATEAAQHSDRDTDGNQLSKAQMEYFKDSKERDDDGKLRVMYRGDPQEINVFDRKRSKPSNLYGRGFYFTASKEHADQYGKPRAHYLNAVNPLEPGQHSITKEQVLKFLQAIEQDGEDYDLYNYGEGATAQSVLESVWGKGDFEMLQDISASAIGDLVAAAEWFNQINGTNYDSIRLPTETVIFQSNQAKLTSNEMPTDDPDVRYSDRDSESVSNRSLLANAFEGLAQHEVEKQKLQEYKDKIATMNAEEQKLQELNAQIHALSFAKGPRDTKKIRALRDEAIKITNRINIYDKQLLRLEASKPLQNVLEREKKAAYKRAEKKGQEALDAYRERATKAQQQMREKWQESRAKAVESRHKTEMRHKIQRVVKKLNDLLLRETKDKHVPEALKSAVADALDAINMDTVGAEERIAKYDALIAKETDPDVLQSLQASRDRITQSGQRLAERIEGLKAAYDGIRKSAESASVSVYDEVIANKIQETVDMVGKTALRDMSYAQLEAVYEMYTMVAKSISNANKAFKEALGKTITEMGANTIREVRATGGSRQYAVKALEGTKKFGWNLLKPYYAFSMIGSDTLSGLYENVRKGEDVWAKDVADARSFYRELAQKYGYDGWDMKKGFAFADVSGREFSLSLPQIMSLYAYSKRAQADKHLEKGGFVFDSAVEVVQKKNSIPVKYKVNTANAYNLTRDMINQIVDTLSNEQVAFVDEMQEYLSSVMGEKGNEVSMALYDVRLFKEKHYFPLKSASQYTFQQTENTGEVKLKNSGFSKATVANASNPVILSDFMDVWGSHVNDMSMYHAFVLPLEDFNRVYNYKTLTSEDTSTESVKGAVQNAYGTACTKYIKQLLEDINGGARVDDRADVMNKWMGKFKKGSVFANASVVIQQPSAIARAAALVDLKYFIGRKIGEQKHQALWDEVKKYAPVAIIKEMGYFDTNMGRSTVEYITANEYSSVNERAKALFTDESYRDELLSRPAALADEISWCYIWEAVKRETAAKHTGLDTTSEAFLKKAGERFTEVITRTQVYDSVLSRSGIMRSKDTGAKMLTAFMSEPTTNLNMVVDALVQGKRGNRQYTRTAIGAVVASQIINSLLVSFVYAARDDDEDKTYEEKYLASFAAKSIESLNPLSYLPFIKDIVSITRGYTVERSDMAVISDIWTAWQKLSNPNVSAYRKTEDFAGSVAQAFGLPLKNIMRDARSVWQTAASFFSGQDTTGAGIGAAIYEEISGKEISNGRQLYDAYRSGDSTQIARVTARFKTEADADSALRSVIREELGTGVISEKEAIDMLVRFGVNSQKDAEKKVGYWVFKEMYPNVELSEAKVATYQQELAPVGITLEAFARFNAQASEISGEDRKARVVALIHGMELTTRQKDALYLTLYAKSGLSDTPWH